MVYKKEETICGQFVTIEVVLNYKVERRPNGNIWHLIRSNNGVTKREIECLDSELGYVLSEIESWWKKYFKEESNITDSVKLLIDNGFTKKY
jgi:hypothetical protein